jgi:hypothetical protein
VVVEGEYSTLSSQFLVPGSWFLVPGSRFLVPGSRFSVLGSWFLVLGSRLLSSAIEIASGRLFAGRPPAWTLPRRPHRRSPGAKRPLRRGFNRTPEQLPRFSVLEMLLIIRTAQHRYIVRREDVATLRAMTRGDDGRREDADPSVIAVELGPLIDPADVSTVQRRHALIIPLRRRNIALLVDAVDTIVEYADVQPLPPLLRERLREPWTTGVLLINDQPVVQLDVRAIARSILLQRTRASEQK